MLARIHRTMEERDEGFTLIELLVVVIIIGILAAIAIPVFLSQRNKGYDSQAKSDARNLATLEETYFNDNSYYQAGASLAAVQGALPDYKKSSGVKAVVLTAYPAPSGTGVVASPNVTNANGSFCVDVQSQSNAHFYYNSKSGGLTTTVCPASQ